MDNMVISDKKSMKEILFYGIAAKDITGFYVRWKKL